MGSGRFASGKHSIADCDICSFRFKLSELRKLVVKDNVTGIKACPECWNQSHPQLRLGELVVEDPQGVREPRPDVGQQASRNIVINGVTYPNGVPFNYPKV